ncbi:hypothetical protein [Sphaerisporangium rhizosphaerae]|uniref:Uncharacterized protein n=1 Tax=Sphaerisporangium rhizosphaerae TaxID=2269375 RepID=A0ABW2PJ08_9ACTN
MASRTTAPATPVGDPQWERSGRGEKIAGAAGALADARRTPSSGSAEAGWERSVPEV